MDRKRVYIPRRYRHRCPANDNAETQITAEICPDCGQRGEFGGFFQGIITRMALQSRLLGFSSNAGHTAFLPTMSRTCPRCHGEGIALGEDFDYECPDCSGLGGFLILDDEPMRKIRRWVTDRLQRRGERRSKGGKRRKPAQEGGAPATPVFSRDPEDFARGLMGLFDYHKKFDARNKRIGTWMLQCDDHGWDIFMELIEFWDDAGLEMDVHANTVVLNASADESSAVLITLFPPADGQTQRIQVDAQQIRDAVDKANKGTLPKRIVKRILAQDGCVNVDHQFTLRDAWDLLGLAECMNLSEASMK